MAEAMLWTNISDPTSTRERNLLAAERRAHAARVSHQRRKAAKTNVLKPSPRVKIERTFHFVSSSSGLGHSENEQDDGLINIEYPAVIFTYSKADEDAILQLFREGTDCEDKKEHFDGTISPLKLIQAPNDISTVFDQPYQRQSFHIWTTILSHRTANYGFYCKDIFLRLIPQLCLKSAALRHMVLAHSLAHQYRRANPHAVRNGLLPTQALYHYTKGLKEMYQVKSHDNDFLAAICMAALVEAGQNNHAGSMQHVKGYEEVFSKYQGKHDEDYQTLRSGYFVIKVFGELMALGKVPSLDPAPWSVERAREDIKEILRAMEDRLSLADPLVLHQHKVALGQWFNAERDWNRTYEASINREATLLLLHFAIALMPQYEAGELSSDVEPRQIIYLIAAANDFLDQGRHLDIKEQRQLCETLELLAVSIVKNIRDLECRRRATDLLQEIMLRNVKVEEE